MISQDAVTTISDDSLEKRSNELNPYGEQPPEAAFKAATEEAKKELAEKGIPLKFGIWDNPILEWDSNKVLLTPTLRKLTLDFRVLLTTENNHVLFKIDEKGLHVDGFEKMADGAPQHVEDATFEWPTETPITLTFGRSYTACDLGIGFDPNMSRQHLKLTLYPDHKLQIQPIGSKGSIIEAEGVAEGLEAAETAINEWKNWENKKPASFFSNN